MVILPVPGDLCRECGLCCRFSDPEVLTPWAARPSVDAPLPVQFLAKRPIGLVDAVGRMDLPVLACDAFSAPSGHCSLWGAHPADCRLYPLVLVHRDGGFLLALDPDCPYASREPRTFFKLWAERFRDREWVSLGPSDRSRIRDLAASEDRPHYQAVLSLPEPEDPRLG